MTIDPRIIREIVIFARQAWRIVLVVPVAGIAYVVLSVIWSILSLQYFYYVRPIVQEMGSVSGGISDDSPSARDTLLRNIPIGTDATAAVAVLVGEGFRCAKQPLTSELHWVCRLQAPSFIGWTNWTIELQFDEPGYLTGAKVAVWSVGL
jgi:hypothetical protein